MRLAIEVISTSSETWHEKKCLDLKMSSILQIRIFQCSINLTADIKI